MGWLQPLRAQVWARTGWRGPGEVACIGAMAGLDLGLTLSGHGWVRIDAATRRAVYAPYLRSHAATHRLSSTLSVPVSSHAVSMSEKKAECLHSISRSTCEDPCGDPSAEHDRPRARVSA
eukprot:350528-Chlamydomonas_euryale.AAC.2